MIDIAGASEFMRTNARLLDRRRFELLFAAGSGEAVLGALSGYANPDGGFGYGLEPDLRSVSSQPGGALHAFEVLEDIAPETSPVGVRLCDWLGSVSFDDGSLPFAFAIEDGAGSAPFWVNANPSEPRCSSPAPSPAWRTEWPTAIPPWRPTRGSSQSPSTASRRSLLSRTHPSRSRFDTSSSSSTPSRTSAPGHAVSSRGLGRCCPRRDRFRSLAAPRERG
jgi:hypothetical protein